MQLIAAVVKHETVEIRWGLIRFGIPFPAVAVVTTHQQSPIATAGPNGTVIGPGHIHIAVTIGDRDDRLAPVLVVNGIFVKANLSASSHHPQLSVRLVADALQALTADALVHLPDVLTRSPSGIEVAEAAHAYISAFWSAAQIANRTCCVTHLRFPASASVTGAIDRANIGSQFGCVRSKSGNQVGLSWQLGVKKEPGPIIATIGGVHQQARLTGNPAIVAVEGDAD